MMSSSVLEVKFGAIFTTITPDKDTRLESRNVNWFMNSNSFLKLRSKTFKNGVACLTPTIIHLGPVVQKAISLIQD